ncbi:hypothetical protein S40288_11633 [Stachybotrys chartarum IBT 40288]|nr:hypothetical protein S40288_11633 [Stachybotrys chartarum IBT 40288]
MSLELRAEGNEGLDIASTTNDLDDDVEADAPGAALGVGGLSALSFIIGSRPLLGQQERQRPVQSRIEVNIDVSVVFTLTL